MLGENLFALRKKQNLTQIQLADAVGISRQSYNNYENNRREPDYALIKTLADYFNVTTDYLLGRDEKKEIHPSETDGEIVTLLHKLSPDGQSKVKEYIDDLVQSGKYAAENKKAHPLKEQADDDVYILPVAARSGEQASIKTTKARIEADIANLKQSDEDDL